MLLKTEEEIRDWCDVNKIYKYTINNDLTVDVSGHVILRTLDYDTLPVRFGKVSLGGFMIFGDFLTSLENSPYHVDRNFTCEHTKVTSLKGCPRYVGGSLNVTDNKLTSLDYLPDHIGKWIEIARNKIERDLNYYKTLQHMVDSPSYPRIKALEDIPFLDEYEIKNMLVMFRMDTIANIIKHP